MALLDKDLEQFRTIVRTETKAQIEATVPEMMEEILMPVLNQILGRIDDVEGHVKMARNVHERLDGHDQRIEKLEKQPA